jgi:glycosyltransferase involved in cell wall biosynthesis
MSDHPASHGSTTAKLFSVIIPALNEGETICGLLSRVTVEAVLPPEEVIVVDAGSTDDTCARVLNWIDLNPRYNVRCLSLLERAYPGDARNRGVEISSHDHIAFVDCAMVPESDWLEQLAEAFVEEGEQMVVWGRVRPLAATPWERAFASVVERRPRGNERVVPGSAVTKALFSAAGGFAPHLRSGEDLLYIRAITALGPPESFSQALVWYTGYPASLVRAYKKWRLYGYNGVVAGFGARKALLCLGELILLLTAGWLGMRFAGLWGSLSFAALAYIVRCCFSMFLSPVKVLSWRELACAFGICAAVDAGRFSGFVRGIFCHGLRGVFRQSAGGGKRGG